MDRILTITKSSILLFSILFLSSFIKRDTCDSLYPLHTGAEFEMTSYNAVGVITSKTYSKVLASTPITGGSEVKVNTEIFDQNNKSIENKDVKFQCKNGSIFMDMGNYIPKKMFDEYPGMDVKVKTDFMETPGTLTVGTALKDAEMSVSITAGGFEMGKMTLYITNRKVEAEETITTPAGTFKCFKLSYNMEYRTVMGATTSQYSRCKEWICPGTGTVKTQDYDTRDNLRGYSELTKLKK